MKLLQNLQATIQEGREIINCVFHVRFTTFCLKTALNISKILLVISNIKSIYFQSKCTIYTGFIKEFIP